MNPNQNFKLKNHSAWYNGNATYVALYIFVKENAFEKHTSVVFARSASSNCSTPGDQAHPLAMPLKGHKSRP